MAIWTERTLDVRIMLLEEVQTACRNAKIAFRRHQEGGSQRVWLKNDHPVEKLDRTAR